MKTLQENDAHGWYSPFHDMVESTPWMLKLATYNAEAYFRSIRKREQAERFESGVASIEAYRVHVIPRIEKASKYYGQCSW